MENKIALMMEGQTEKVFLHYLRDFLEVRFKGAMQIGLSRIRISQLPPRPAPS
jgi:hypothetical protein